MTAVQFDNHVQTNDFGSAVMLKGKRDYQQDAFYLADDFIVLADGMGGQPDGDLASRLAVNAAVGSLLSSDLSAEAVRIAFEVADQEIADLVAPGADNRMPYGRHPENWPATTMIIAARQPDGSFVIGHLGDSRAWIFDPTNKELIQLTTDHESWYGSITRYVGGHRHAPDILTVNATDEGPFNIVVASDGLFQRATNDDLQDVLALNADLSDAVKANALARHAELSGSTDNITVAVVGGPVS